jgi:hypothetical protein
VRSTDKKKILLIGGLGIAAYFLFMKKSAPAEAVLAPGYAEDYLTDNSPSIPVSQQAAPLQNYLAIEDRNLLIKYSGNNAAWISAFNRMNDQEIINSWEYMWSYLLKNKKLYRLPGPTGIYADGGWNTQLYDAIEAIRAKYKIF